MTHWHAPASDSNPSRGTKCGCGAGCNSRRLGGRLMQELLNARAGLRAVAGVTTDGFCCPLCLRLLPFSCASEAHAPARRARGEAKTFLCKACNNYLGFSYEAAAVEALAQIRAQAAGERIPVRASVATPGGPHLFVEAQFGPSAVVAGDGASTPRQIPWQTRGRSSRI